MAAASAASTVLGGASSHLHHLDTAPNAGKGEGPTFGMQKGSRVQPGRVFWQGQYIDQSQFYRNYEWLFLPWMVYQFLYAIVMLYGPSIIAYLGFPALVNNPAIQYNLLLGLIPITIGLVSLYFWVHVKVVFDQLLRASRLPQVAPAPPPPPPQAPISEAKKAEKAHSQQPLTIAVMAPYPQYERDFYYNSMYDGGYLYGQEFVQTRHKASAPIVEVAPSKKMLAEEEAEIAEQEEKKVL